MTLANLRAEVWGPGETTWEWGVAHCLSMVEPHLVYGGGVIDYGCGVGRLMKPLARKHRGTQFVGVDIDIRMLLAANEKTRANEEYRGSIEGLRVRSAYSVITFQHMSDAAVAEIIRRLYPAKLRFQFAIGDNQSDYNYQRSEKIVESWCHDTGYGLVTIESDPVFETWRWATCD